MNIESINFDELKPHWDGNEISCLAPYGIDYPQFALKFPELTAAFCAAKAAGDFVASYYGMTCSFSEKSPKDVVSEIDIRSEQIIKGILLANDPKSEFISEENADGIRKLGKKRTWIIDPLDSSISFVKQAGGEYCSILIALAEEGIIKGSLVYFPITNEWFYAAKGQGAFKDGLPLFCSNQDIELRQSLIEINRYSNSKYDSSLVKRLESSLRGESGCLQVCSSIPHSGIAMRMLEGRVDAVIHDNQKLKVKQEIWDIAPIGLIVEEAGGVVLDLGSGKSYDLANPSPLVMSKSNKLAYELVGLGRKKTSHMIVINS